MNGDLSKLEIDTIAEVGNISLGSSATALSNILGKKVNISTPQVGLLKVRDLKRYYPVPCLLAEIKYISGLEGSNLLLIKEQDALLIAAQMMQVPLEEAGRELSEMELSAIGEAMNQMMGYASTAMSEMFNRQIQISPPHVGRCDLADNNAAVNGLPDDAPVVQVSFRMQVEEILDSIILQVIPLPFARKMASDLLAGTVADFPETPELAGESAMRETAAAGVPVDLNGPGVFGSELHLEKAGADQGQVQGPAGFLQRTLSEIGHRF
jgi:flagellar motor switch protein FliN/FliY